MTHRFHSAGFVFAMLAMPLALPITACAASGTGDKKEATIVLGEADAGAKRHDVTVGQVVEVQLVEQGGTGFSWTLTKGAGVEQVGEPTYSGGQALPGSGQIQTFKLRVTAKGEHLVRFNYSQLWNGGEKDAKVLTFTLIAA